MNDFDLIVIGAGPAGIMAAVDAVQYDLKVLLIDESPQAGGQIYRALNQAIKSAPESVEKKCGDQLRSALLNRQISTRFEHRVWSIEPQKSGYRVASVGPKSSEDNQSFNTHIDEVIFEAHAPQVIIATGAQERIFALPGWTLPGVVGLAATTVMLKSHKILPGEKVVVAGVGPLLLLVTNEIIKAGGKVVALIDLSSRRCWLKRMTSLLSKPKLMFRGIGWLINIFYHRVKIYNQHSLVEISGKQSVEHVKLAPVDNHWRPQLNQTISLKADSVCLGHGLIPSTELTQLLGIEHHYDKIAKVWKPALDGGHRSSLPGVYVCGDGGGIQGAEAAPIQGRIAALSALKNRGLIDEIKYHSFYTALKKDLIQAQKFGTAMNRLCTPKSGLLKLITPSTIVCRCESLTRNDIENSIVQGNSTINAIKSVSRCGMGACGGRFCKETVTMIVSNYTGCQRKEIGMASIRPPIRPIPVKPLIGNFKYHDLPIPEPAPE